MSTRAARRSFTITITAAAAAAAALQKLRSSRLTHSLCLEQRPGPSREIKRGSDFCISKGEEPATKGGITMLTFPTCILWCFSRGRMQPGHRGAALYGGTPHNVLAVDFKIIIIMTIIITFLCLQQKMWMFLIRSDLWKLSSIIKKRTRYKPGCWWNCQREASIPPYVTTAPYQQEIILAF